MLLHPLSDTLQLSLEASSASKEGSTRSTTPEATYSAIESLMRAEERERLLYRQEQLLEEIHEMITGFDDTLGHLHHEKALVDVMCKTTDLK